MFAVVLDTPLQFTTRIQASNRSSRSDISQIAENFTVGYPDSRVNYFSTYQPPYQGTHLSSQGQISHLLITSRNDIIKWRPEKLEEI